MLKTFIAVVSLLGALSLRAVEINVFAAASLTDSLKEICAIYEKRSGNEIICSFDASSQLATQIEHGAPVDIFFSADEAQMNELQQKKLILKNTRRILLSNSLAIVVPSNSSLVIQSLNDLTNDAVKRVAVGNPQTVPIGVYAKAYLEKKNLWSAVETKIVPSQSVRTALAAIENGEVDCGIVYKTDALISKKVRLEYEIPPDQGPDISYPVAVLKESQHVDEAKKFIEYLASEEAAEIFRKCGFIIRN